MVSPGSPPTPAGGVHQHHAGDLVEGSERRGEHVEAAEGMARQHIGPWNVSALQQGVEVGRYLGAVLGAVSGLAPPATGAVIDTDTVHGRRPARSTQESTRHPACARFEHDSGRALAGAAPGAGCVPPHVDQLPRHQVGLGIGCFTPGLVAATVEASASIAITGYSSQRPPRLCSCRWTQTIIQANASMAGGHAVEHLVHREQTTTRSRPPSPMNSAGAAAHRCG